jgi:hypothetical protein
MEADIVLAQTNAVASSKTYTDGVVAPILTKNTAQDTRLTNIEAKNTAQDNTLASHTSTLSSHTDSLAALTGGGGGTGGGIAPMSSDSVRRPLIGARVGSGSLTPPPDSQYFAANHALETAMGADLDIANWYRGIGTTSAADFTATVKPELLAHPNLRVNYVFEMDKSNAQFNREFAAKDGIYPHLLATLQAIKDSGVADRVTLAPFHEGNGGGGTPGSIGSYVWQMYDTNTGQLYTPDPNDFTTGTPYGSTFRLNTPAQYKTAFRNFVSLARSLDLPCKIIQWFLAANSSDSLLVDEIERMDMSPGYAGDDYVDIIGLSYYNRSKDPRPQYSDTWPQPGANGLREFYSAVEKITKRPLWLCETGCAMSNEYGDQGQWYADLVKLVASDQLPRIEGMVMFMQDTRKYDGPGGAWSAGMDMRLQNTTQKQLLGRAINAARRPTKVNTIPQLGRNLLPLAASSLTTTDGWVASAGTTLAVGTQYAPDMDSTANGLRITKPAFVTGDTKTTHNVYRRGSKANIDYVPNDPYVLSFNARASYDGFRIEAGIRQDGGTATTLGDELTLTTLTQQYIVPFSGITDDPTLTGWRIPNFNFGNNANTASAWFEISDLRLTRGSEAQPNVERLLLPRVKPLTGNPTLSEINWNCEAGGVFDVTLTQNYTLRAPSGTAVDAQEIVLRVKQDGTGGRSLNLHTDFYNSAANPVIATGANAYTYLRFHYLAATGKWGPIGTVVWA